MTKHQMAVTIVAALHNITEQKAESLAEKGFGEYETLMKNKKSHLEEMYVQAQIVLQQKENN